MFTGFLSRFTGLFSLSILTVFMGCEKTEKVSQNAPNTITQNSTPSIPPKGGPSVAILPKNTQTEPLPPSDGDALQFPAESLNLLREVNLSKAVVAGNWSKTPEGALHVKAADGARLRLPGTPRGDYEYSVTFTRHTGKDSVALLFPHEKGYVAFEAEAWGEKLGGLQNINGKSIKENRTRTNNVSFPNGEKQTMRIEVKGNRIRGFLNQNEIASYESDGWDLSVPNVWDLQSKNSIGIGVWNSETTFHSVVFRPLGGGDVAQVPPKKNPPMVDPIPKPKDPTPPVKVDPKPKEKAPEAKKALLVIANYHFFYREYNDPKTELENAGVKVTVAAGKKGDCTCHENSGEPKGRGTVQAEIALKDAKAADYDTIIFAGGWGSSAYQYAFNGRYNDANYNGEKAIKDEANRLINQFIAANKPVCAVCNGVSVLAWARVDGKSPLNGKKVCAPTIPAPPGTYPNLRTPPPNRWHAETNGATVQAAGAIGRANTAEDDVQIDGKIITGQDDTSAREFGRQIAKILNGK